MNLKQSTRRRERSTIITSNKSLTEWGKALKDTSLAQALIDRLIHHGEVYYLKGDSYRLKGKADLLSDDDTAIKREHMTEENSKVGGGEKVTEN